MSSLRDARWGVALGLLYLVLCAVLGLLLEVRELERTAAHGDELVRTVPYWRVP